MSDASGMRPAQQAQAQQAQAQQTRPQRSRAIPLPGQNLSIEETLRVMDVARELRDQRETAEEMFRRDDWRSQLREKLMRTAQMSGDSVTEAEIDAAIGQYFDSLHMFKKPESRWANFVAHGWVWRGRILAVAAAVTAVAGGFWFLFS